MPTLLDPRQRRIFAQRLALAFLAILLALGTPEPMLAQVAGTRVQAPGADRITRRLQSISPRSGPPGTVVTVASALMPHITPVRVGMGATRIGFEALAELLTSVDGDFSVNVTVPEWARWDRNHRFILFDFYFNPIAASDAFYVTDAEGRMRREGEVSSEARCPAIRDTDGELFALLGDSASIARYPVGARVVVTGTFVEGSTCGDTPTLRVSDIRSPTAPTRE
jgi:hypothetical protein